MILIKRLERNIGTKRGRNRGNRKKQFLQLSPAFIQHRLILPDDIVFLKLIGKKDIRQTTRQNDNYQAEVHKKVFQK